MKEKFVVAEWSECQFFMEDSEKIHLADADNAYRDFGDSAYFVEKDFYEEKAGRPVFENEKIYLAVSFPESELFKKENADKIYQVTDENGIQKFGKEAYFVEENLYQKIRKEFETKKNIAQNDEQEKGF